MFTVANFSLVTAKQIPGKLGLLIINKKCMVTIVDLFPVSLVYNNSTSGLQKVTE